MYFENAIIFVLHILFKDDHISILMRPITYRTQNVENFIELFCKFFLSWKLCICHMRQMTFLLNTKLKKFTVWMQPIRKSEKNKLKIRFRSMMLFSLERLHLVIVTLLFELRIIIKITNYNMNC